jgi:hypothetical protein
MDGEQRVPHTTREISVLAEDPSVRMNGNSRKPLMTKVRIPSEILVKGPRGSRIEVIDYDSSTGHFYEPYVLPQDEDPYADADDIDKLLADPGFHAHQVFGVASATLFEFERALGRNLSWGFAGRSHQLKILPHAFREANAFYSRSEESLLFGYFANPDKPKKTVFTCLSHDIVAHETTHAILDGLRDQLIRPSSPDQAAFHEGFADIIALLSNLRSEALIQVALKASKPRLSERPSDRIDLDKTLKALETQSFLSGLADEMGKATGSLGRGALRRSVGLAPNPDLMKHMEEPHERGEILVAAVMHSFMKVWHARLAGKYKDSVVKPASENGEAAAPAPSTRRVDAWRVAEEGAKAAQHLLTMVIRAIDYLPPAHVEFKDFLMAMITSDWQTCPDDSSYHYRELLLASFKAFGIEPHGGGTSLEKGAYKPIEDVLQYSRGNNSSMRSDCDGMFRFLWENREKLNLAKDAYTRVNSVRPVWRVAPDGFILHETVAEYYQLARNATIAELRHLEIPVPPQLGRNDTFNLFGGGTLIFDEFGRLKFHISNNIASRTQSKRLSYLHSIGQLRDIVASERPFAMNHLRRSGLGLRKPPEDWT